MKDKYSASIEILTAKELGFTGLETTDLAKNYLISESIPKNQERKLLNDSKAALEYLSKQPKEKVEAVYDKFLF